MHLCWSSLISLSIFLAAFIQMFTAGVPLLGTMEEVVRLAGQVKCTGSE